MFKETIRDFIVQNKGIWVFSKEILSSWKNTIAKVGNIQINTATFVSNLNYTQEMKKIFALAFVAGMVTFAACTSKPADESADTTAVTVETPAIDTTVVDSMATDTAAADSVK
ncbi:hypothetical protein [Dyadobacter psychrophilus]|uniref:Uncharacterized protein n=1 Tax=Dyadobacter psychrophilus TaxID=651661 RepID=A0A1T5GZ89_9BACT|nr:hypothetical protein [Dyadobacter psychrophilus]SKC13753.1 hypothetical protein SAMN05660293_04641 [Dyadobacter psychrophilus]